MGGHAGVYAVFTKTACEGFVFHACMSFGRDAAYLSVPSPGIAVRRTASLPLAYVPVIPLRLAHCVPCRDARTSPGMKTENGAATSVSPPKPRHQFNMRRVAELIDRRHALDLESSVDQDAGVAGEGHRVA